MRISSIRFLFHLILFLFVAVPTSSEGDNNNNNNNNNIDEDDNDNNNNNDDDDRLIVSCETTKGTFDIELIPKWAPVGVSRFIDLVNDDFFSNAYLFRVIPNFVVQFGIAGSPEKHAEWVAVGPIPDDPRVPDLGEGVGGSDGSFPRGGVAFAGKGDNSRLSQIFIPFRDHAIGGKNPWETQIGTVIRGMDVLESLFSGYGDIQDFNPKGIIPYQLEDEGESYVEASFPKMDKILSCDVESTSEEFDLMPKYVSVKFVNEMDRDVHLFFVDDYAAGKEEEEEEEQQELIHEGKLDAGGGKLHLDCYSGHKFVIKDTEDGSGPVLASYEVEYGVMNYLFGDYDDEEDEGDKETEEEGDEEVEEEGEEEGEEEEDDEEEGEEEDEIDTSEEGRGEDL